MRDGMGREGESGANAKGCEKKEREAGEKSKEEKGLMRGNVAGRMKGEKLNLH